MTDTNLIEYIKGLSGLADKLGLIIAGSTLNGAQTAALSYIQGYLQAADSYVQEPTA